MRRLKREIAELRRHAGGRYIELADGGVFRYSREDTAVELFRFTMDFLQSELDGRPRPAPPPVMQAVVQAKDRRATVSQLYPSWETTAPCCAFDLAALAERGVLRYLRLPPEPVAEADVVPTVVPVARPRGER